MKPETKLILQTLGRYKGRYALGALGLAGSDVGQLVTPYLVGQVIDRLSAHHLDAHGVELYALGILACAVFTALSRLLWRQCVFGAGRFIECDLRERLYDHLKTLSASFFLDNKIGALMAHATNDVSAIRGVAGEGVMSGVDGLFMFIGSAGMMLGTVDWRLALAALAPMVFLPFASYGIGRRLHSSYRLVQDAFSVLSDRVQENIAGIRVVKGFVRETQQIAHFGETNEAYRRAYAHMARYDRAMDPTVSLLSGASFAIALGVGGHMVLAGQLTLGQYVAFNSFLAMLTWPMLAWGWVINILQRGSASAARLQALFDVRPEVADAPDAQAPEVKGHLSLRGLTFAYGPELPNALENISIEAEPGRVIGILGTTGSGKTTLANLLARLFNPPSGQVLLDGVDVLDWPLQQLRRAIAYVPQDSFLFSRTIRENIALEPEPHTEDEILESSRLAQLDGDVQG
ncbi:MAG TPA: ABC transporter transmembrane domain-containing protein, partial [Oscillatoriaceae cyanobacterium]